MNFNEIKKIIENCQNMEQLQGCIRYLKIINKKKINLNLKEINVEIEKKKMELRNLNI